MRLSQVFGLAVVCSSPRVSADISNPAIVTKAIPPSAVNAERPIQAYDVANPTRLNATMGRDGECKSCPFGNCLNAGIIWRDTQVQFQCFTQGEAIGNSKTWLRYQFGARQDEFCYVNTFDLQPYFGDYSAELPYCGTKSELHLYLPSQRLKTVYYTECSICPYRDCDGIKYYQSGTILDVNCEVNDGWLQLGPLHPEGSKKYYRTPDNCYVSVQTVEDIPARVINIAGLPSPLSQDVLPPCGPVPHIRVEDRPGLVGDAFMPSKPLPTSAAPKATTATGPKPVTLPLSYNQGSKPRAPGQISRLNVTGGMERRSSDAKLRIEVSTQPRKEHMRRNSIQQRVSRPEFDRLGPCRSDKHTTMVGDIAKCRNDVT